MNKLIYFHYKLLMNKRTFFLLFITLLFIAIVYLLQALDHSGGSERIYAYFVNSYFYVKLILSFISIFLFASSMTSKGDYSIYTLRMFEVKRTSSFIAKMISITLILFLLTIGSFILFLGIGLTINHFYLELQYAFAFLNLFLCSIIYGLIGIFLIQKTNHYFVIIVTIVLNIFINGLENQELENFIFKIIVFLFPKLDEIGTSYFGSLQLLWCLVLYCLLNLWIYNKRDLNY